ncbi:MAG: Lrp/AsnC family transcriptional regulator [Acidobacteriota bacterium]
MTLSRSQRSPRHGSAESGQPFHAFVLIQTVPGRVEGVLRVLRRLPAVQSAHPVTGPFDIVAQVEVRRLQELSDVVAGTIGGLRGVTRTTTLLCTDQTG